MGGRVDRELLAGLGVRPAVAERWAPELAAKLPASGVDTALRTAHFLAQVLHESRRLAVAEEDLRYSAARLREVFPRHFDPPPAEGYAGRPERIANRVYRNRLGNGDEASGDGYRYRGRGFLQVTGKDNYRGFAAWVGEDCVARPDDVARVHPVDSALWYWESRRLNEAADVDDPRLATKRVNGGLNGLADRLALLDRAKLALGVAAAVTTLAGATHRVAATGLHLRSRPVVSTATRLAVLPQGTPVAVLADADPPGWVRVRTLVTGRIAEGFVAARYLAPLARRARGARAQRGSPGLAPLPAVPSSPSDPWGNGKVRDRVGRARRSDREGRNASPHRRAAELLRLARRLGSRARQRGGGGGGRAMPAPGHRLAQELCERAGVYLPRVWWTGEAIARLRRGEDVVPEHGRTVRELTVNALFDWLADYGPDFGWRRELDLDVLQAAASNGDVCLVVAQRAALDLPGRIAVVLPEHGRLAARRNAAGEVVRPLEWVVTGGAPAQVRRAAWWRGRAHREAAFWRHA